MLINKSIVISALMLIFAGCSSDHGVQEHDRLMKVNQDLSIITDNCNIQLIGYDYGTRLYVLFCNGKPVSMAATKY